MPTKTLTPEAFRAAIGDFIRAETLEKFSLRAGVNKGFLFRIRHGQAWPGETTLGNLAAAMGMKITWRKP